MLSRRQFGRSVLLTTVATLTCPATAWSDTSPTRQTSTTLPPATFAAQGTRQVRISPRGDALAWLDISIDRTRLIILDLGGGPASTIRVPDIYRARSLNWFNDEFLALTVTFTRVPVWARRGEVFVFERTLMVSRDGNTSKLLSPGPNSEDNPNAGLANFGAIDDDYVIMYDFIYDVTRDVVRDSHIETKQDNAWRPAIAAINTKTNARRELALGELNTVDWIFDQKGYPKMRVDLDAVSGKCDYIKLGRLGSRTIVKTYNTGNGIVPLSSRGMLDDNTALFIDTSGEYNKAVKMDISTGTLSPAFTDIPEEMEDIIQDPYTRLPLGVSLVGPETRNHWIDPQLRDLASKLSRAFAGKEVDFGGWSRDRKKIIVLVQSGATPVSRYLFDTATLQATQIGGEVEDLDQFDFGSKTKVTYQSRDNVAITAWLTTPPQGAGPNKPFIVMPHGGPQSQDDSGFDYFAQFLASRGYCVLQPQFRGSTGFGASFEEAGVGEWGGKMQDDVSDGVAWALAQGHAKAGNVGIVGASYGGYSALAGATMTPDLYACAASINGVSSLGLFQGYRKRADSGRSGREAYWEYHMGLTRFDEDKIRAKSPAFLATQAKAPILLLHGTDDTVVPIIQSRTMANALRDAAKPYEFIELSKDDHYLSLMTSRVRVFEELQRFLALHLKK